MYYTRFGMLMLTLLMWCEVQPVGFFTIACAGVYKPSLFLSRIEARTPIGAVEVLGAFDLAGGPQV